MSDTNERTEKAYDTTNTVRSPDAPAKKGKTKADGPDDSLLVMDEHEAAEQMLKEWDESWKQVKNYVEQWKVNRARSQGYVGVQLIKKQDRMQAYIPTGAKKSVAGMNKAARLRRRLRAVLFADPPRAEAMPSTDSDEDRDSAETSTRILDDQCSEGNLAYNLHAGDAFDLGGDYGSGFIRLWVDETGGGWKPKEMMASPQAVSADDPFPIDPQTGQPRPCDPITRFVTKDGQFTEDTHEAERVWLPKLKDEVLTGKQVRFLPGDVRDLWEADGAMIGTAITLGELELLFPDVKEWDEARKGKLIEARPQHFKDILEPHQKDSTDAKVSSHALVFVLTRYHVLSPRYPTGAYLIAAGADELLHRSDWYDHEHSACLDIPLTQFKQFTDEGNPYGEGVMCNLGPGNEVRGQLLGSMLEHLRRFQNRHLFIPMTSTLQPAQLSAPTGTPIPILPGGQPIYEELPDFPVVVEKMEKLISADMDDESGLGQAIGQNINPPGVKSALHAQVIQHQVQQGISDLRQNTERALIRGWRVMLQLIRAYFTVPQQVSWVGDDGRFKQQRWTGADLGDTHDVRIERGSFTQLAPQAKAELAQHFKEQGLLNPADLEHVIETNVGGIMGLEDNPHRLRVRRQISAWQEGPPKDFQPPPMQAPPQVPGQPPQPLPNPFGAILAPMFQAIPADDEPIVAALRAYELGRAMASTKFDRWPAPWKQGIITAYQQARQAAQLPDAKMLQGLQQQLKETKDELMNAKIKLNAASVSFSGKLADLDEAQTLVIMAKEGIQLPPKQAKAPGSEEQHQVQIEHIKTQAELQKQRIQMQGEVQREHIKTAGKLKESEAQRAHALQMARLAPKTAQAAGAKAKGGAMKPGTKIKVVRGQDGKMVGAEVVP